MFLNDVFAPVAKEAGIEVTLDDVKELNEAAKDAPLDLDQLEQVNGGFVLAAFIVAGIGGAIAGAITCYELKR